MSNSIFNILFLSVVIFSCSKEDPIFAEKALNTAFEINYNETISIEPGSVIIKFEDVVSDSRCAVDVVCVWEGELTVRLIVNNQVIEISNITNTTSGTNSEVTIGNYKITFLNKEIKPTPYSNIKYGLDIYRILLKVEKV